MKKVVRKISWTPLSDNLYAEGVIVDNELELATKSLGVFSKAHLFGLVKTKGFVLKEVLFSLLLCPFLGVPSLNFFCGNRLSAFFSGGKDVLYDFLKRQTIDWRGYRFHIAKNFYRKHGLEHEAIRAAVVDDTIKTRRGKNVTGSSSHFDHTTGRHVIGHQVLELGLATGKGYIPLDSGIYVSEQKVRHGKTKFKDKRSILSKDYAAAKEKDKNTMFREMLNRTVRGGIRLTHVLADSWFGNRENIKAVLALNLIGLFRMKKSRLHYRINGNQYTLTELYALIKRRMLQMKGTSYRTYLLTLELNLSENPKKEEWVTVGLLFSSSFRRRKENWVVFLTTDPEMNGERILEIYSLRWGVEVYFKEVKQHFGFLKEQTGDYAVHYASIHLSAIRYLLVADRMLFSGCSFGSVRSKITGQMEALCFARLLWELFKTIIYGVLDSLKNVFNSDTIELIKNKIGDNVADFLDKALQLDSDYLDAESKAEKLGCL